MNSILCGLMYAALAFAQPDPDAKPVADGTVGAPLPNWFPAHIAYLTGEGGVWQADNAAYRTAGEPFNAYRVEFTPVFDGWGYSGRLYGLQDGSESPDFWHFRGYWNAADNVAALDQWGWGGAVGQGEVEPMGDAAEPGSVRVTQVFAAPGVPMRREGHDFLVIDAQTHETQAYTIHEDGSRTANRTYTWHRITE